MTNEEMIIAICNSLAEISKEINSLKYTLAPISEAILNQDSFHIWIKNLHGLENFNESKLNGL